MISYRAEYEKSGDNSKEATPVPIPNTEVKLFSAEDTWRAASRQNRTSPVFLCLKRAYPVDMAWRLHLFPSRTQKLSSTALKVLGGQPPGRIGLCRFCIILAENPLGDSLFC